MSNELKKCPQCDCPYGYYMSETSYVCPDCNHDWNPVEEGPLIVKDANGNILQDGDSVVLIKTLKVKGAQDPVKIGTKVKKIRLVEGDHNIACKIEGFGAMGLKSEFVKKA